MKKIVSLLCLALMCIAICLPLASCSNDEAHDGFQIMSSDINDFVIEAPDDWILTSQNGMASAKAPGYDGDLSNISATSFQMLQEIQTAEQYFDVAIVANFKDVHNMQIHERDVDMKIGDKAAKKYVYTLDMYGEEYKYMMVVCAYGGRIYVITYTSTPKFYDTHLDYMTDILNFFKFTV